MGKNATKIKLAEANLAAFRARLASCGRYEKDGLRRQIAAVKARLRELRAEEESTS